jgi:hypothetical protein
MEGDTQIEEVVSCFATETLSSFVFRKSRRVSLLLCFANPDVSLFCDSRRVFFLTC